MLRSIFVSSTFKDMHYERDIIHSKVVPAVNSHSQQYGESIAVCDLRWGIDTSAMSDEESSSKVLRICLDEIDRTRPYMIVILGYRYGWMPGKDRIRSTIYAKEGFSLEDEDISATALEIEYGSLMEPDNIGYTLFYFREIDGDYDQDYQTEDELHKRKLESLKDTIKNIPGAHVRTYHVRTDEGFEKSMDEFADMVIMDLTSLLSEEWQQNSLLDTYTLDQRKQWDYLQEKSVQFLSRQTLVQSCMTAVCDLRKDVLIYGVSGSGKSTLASFTGQLLQKRGYHVIPIFCGLTPLCSTGFDILQYMVWELEELLNMPEHLTDSTAGGSYRLSDWNDYFDSLCRQFDIESDREIVFLVDGIDQLTQDETAENFSFVTSQPCRCVRFVLSAIEDEKVPVGLTRIKVNALSEKESREVIRGITAGRRRELNDDVINSILKRKGASIPLYLNLLIQRLIMMDRQDFLEIAALGGGMDAITAYQMKLVKECPETLGELSVYLLKYASRAVGGSEAFLASEMIAVSRRGLRFSDLSSLMKMYNAKWSELNTASFIQYMKSMFIYRNDGRYDFSHNVIRQGILKQCKNVDELNSAIADCMYSLPETDEVKRQEVIWHLIRGDKKTKFADMVALSLHSNIDVSDMVKDIVANILENNGAWILEVIKATFNRPSFGFLSSFLNNDIYFSIPDTHHNLTVKMRICELLHQAVQKLCVLCETDGRIWDISVADDRLADIHRNFEGKEHLEFALKCVKHSLMLRERLLEKIQEYNTPEKRKEYINNASITAGLAIKGTLTDDMCKAVIDIFYTQYERGICVANTDISEILIDLERDDEAIPYLKETIRRREDMIRRGLDIQICMKDQNKFIELARAYQSMASICQNKKAWEEAHEYCMTALSLCEKAVADEKNLSTLEALCAAKMILAGLYYNVGDEKALSLYLECIPVLEMIDVHSRCVKSQQTLSVAYHNLSIIYGQVEGEEAQKKAKFFFSKSKSIAEDIAARYPSNVATRRKMDITLDQIIGNIKKNEFMLDKKAFTQLGDTYRAAVRLLEEMCSETSYNDVKRIIYIATEIVERGTQSDENQKVRALAELEACDITAQMMMDPLQKDKLRYLIVGLGTLSQKLVDLPDTEEWNEDLLALLNGFGVGEEIISCSNNNRAFFFAEQALKISQQLADDSANIKDLDFLAVSLSKYCTLCMTYQPESFKEFNESLFALSTYLFEQTGNSKYAQMQFMAHIGRNVYSEL